jgi:uncharacterized membrane protein
LIPADPRTARRNAQREELTQELVRLLDAIEQAENALRDHCKDERARIKEVRGMVAERRALLAGKPGQLPLTAKENA